MFVVLRSTSYVCCPRGHEALGNAIAPQEGALLELSRAAGKSLRVPHALCGVRRSLHGRRHRRRGCPAAAGYFAVDAAISQGRHARGHGRGRDARRHRHARGHHTATGGNALGGRRLEHRRQSTVRKDPSPRARHRVITIAAAVVVALRPRLVAATPLAAPRLRRCRRCTRLGLRQRPHGRRGAGDDARTAV